MHGGLTDDGIGGFASSKAVGKVVAKANSHDVAATGGESVSSERGPAAR